MKGLGRRLGSFSVDLGPKFVVHEWRIMKSPFTRPGNTSVAQAGKTKASHRCGCLRHVPNSLMIRRLTLSLQLLGCSHRYNPWR